VTGYTFPFSSPEQRHLRAGHLVLDHLPGFADRPWLEQPPQPPPQPSDRPVSVCSRIVRASAVASSACSRVDRSSARKHAVHYGSTSSTPARSCPLTCAAALDHPNSAASATKPARSGLRSTHRIAATRCASSDLQRRHGDVGIMGNNGNNGTDEFSRSALQPGPLRKPRQGRKTAHSSTVNPASSLHTFPILPGLWVFFMKFRGPPARPSAASPPFGGRQRMQNEPNPKNEHSAHPGSLVALAALTAPAPNGKMPARTFHHDRDEAR